MRGAVMYGPGDVRVEERAAPRIVEPTDAIIRVSGACVCGSDLWPYRGVRIRLTCRDGIEEGGRDPSGGSWQSTPRRRNGR
jgi:threonine dehydrogenase-like Zn-dependent dehydrogenase